MLNIADSEVTFLLGKEEREATPLKVTFDVVLNITSHLKTVSCQPCSCACSQSLNRPNGCYVWAHSSRHPGDKYGAFLYLLQKKALQSYTRAFRDYHLNWGSLFSPGDTRQLLAEVSGKDLSSNSRGQVCLDDGHLDVSRDCKMYM